RISSRGTQVTEHKLGKESQVKPDKQNDSGNSREKFRIPAPGNLWPPEVNATEVAHDRATHHDVVEMGDDEIGVVKMDVQAQASQEQPGKPADGEQTDETQSIEHGRVVRDRTLVQSGGPVKDFDR